MHYKNYEYKLSRQINFSTLVLVMTKKRKHNQITVQTRVEQNPEEFRVDNDILFCNFCDHSVDWTRKSTVDDHLKSLTHKNKKAAYENKKCQMHQQTIKTSLTSFESRKLIIHDLIEAFAAADIPLEKVNSLLPFFKKHCKEGGTIP